MEEYMYNYCSNPNTLLDEDGIKKCNYESTLLKYYGLAKNTQNISQETLDLIKNNDNILNINWQILLIMNYLIYQIERNDRT